VVNHFAISSLFDGGEGEKKIFSYRVKKIRYEKFGEGKNLFVIGQVKVTPEIIPESKEFFFGLISSQRKVFRTWVSEYKDKISFDTLRERGGEYLERGEEEMTQVLTSILGNQPFTIQDTFREERQAIFQKLIQKEFDEHCQVYADLFDRTRQFVETLAREGLEIPYELRVAAEVTLSNRLFREINELKRNFKATRERGEIDRIIEEAKEYGYLLRKEKSLLVLNELLKEKMRALRKSKGSDLSRQAEQIEELMTFLDLVKKWDVVLPLEEAQNLMKELLEEWVGGLEKGWWENGDTQPFPSNLITLAEKLGFNVERFLKLTGSSS
jgi:hypothetical protein